MLPINVHITQLSSGKRGRERERVVRLLTLAPGDKYGRNAKKPIMAHYEKAAMRPKSEETATDQRLEIV